MTFAGRLEISMLPADATDDMSLTAAVASLINDVYAVAEEGLWIDGTPRTTAEEVAGLHARGAAGRGTLRRPFDRVRVHSAARRGRQRVQHARCRPEPSKHGRGTRLGHVRRASRPCAAL